MTNGKPTNYWLVRSIIALILLIIGIFGYTLSKEISKKKQVQNEIRLLELEAEKIEKENMKLEERIAYLGSEDYKKKEAKEKLNLQNPDEKMVVIMQGPAVKQEIGEEPTPVVYKENNIPNYQKWWNLFFE